METARVPSISAMTGSYAALPSSSSTPMDIRQDSWMDGVGNGAPTCSMCGEMILDRMMVQVQGRIMHSACLKCSSCGQDVSDLCFSDGNEVFCQQDFYKLFGAECVSCNGVIAPTESVRRTNEKLYHEGCFSCVLCDCALETGSKYYIRDDNKLVCEKDYENLKKDDEQKSENHRIEHEMLKKLTPLQAKELDKIFRKNQRPSRQFRKQICTKLGLLFKEVNVWFQSQRAVSRRHKRPINKNDSGLFEMNSPAVSPYNNRIDISGIPSYPEPALGDYPKSTQNYLQWWMKDIESLAADAVPPNIDLKVSDFRPGGEVCLNSIDSAKPDYPEGSHWFQHMPGSHCEAAWQTCV